MPEILTNNVNHETTDKELRKITRSIVNSLTNISYFTTNNCGINETKIEGTIVADDGQHYKTVIDIYPAYYDLSLKDRKNKALKLSRKGTKQKLIGKVLKVTQKTISIWLNGK